MQISIYRTLAYTGVTGALTYAEAEYIGIVIMIVIFETYEKTTRSNNLEIRNFMCAFRKGIKCSQCSPPVSRDSNHHAIIIYCIHRSTYYENIFVGHLANTTGNLPEDAHSFAVDQSQRLSAYGVVKQMVPQHTWHKIMGVTRGEAPLTFSFAIATNTTITLTRSSNQFPAGSQNS